MIDTDVLKQLVKTYESHGWQLRRLATVDPRAADLLADWAVPISVGVVDAAWFSRPPADGSIAWELRYLGAAQYALVEHLDETAPDFDDRLHQTEVRLAEGAAAKRTA